MPTPALLEADRISRRAEEGAWLLRHVSLAIQPGDRWAILGPTGAGKTVFLRALVQLDPVQEGQILWQGREIANDDVPDFRRRVIYLHQQPVLFEGSVESNLRLVELLGENGSGGFRREQAIALLATLGRDATFLNKSSDDLSGGEAQTVALLRAVLLEPAILLLDEPTAALDSNSVAAIEQFVDRWLQEDARQRAVVWVSHDAEQIGRVTDKSLYLEHGRPKE